MRPLIGGEIRVSDYQRSSKTPPRKIKSDSCGSVSEANEIVFISEEADSLPMGGSAVLAGHVSVVR